MANLMTLINYTTNLDVSYYVSKYEEVLSKLKEINAETYKEHLIRGYYYIGVFFEFQGDNIMLDQYYRKCWDILKDIDDVIIQENYSDIFNDLSIKVQEWKETRVDDGVIKQEEKGERRRFVDKLWKRNK